MVRLQGSGLPPVMNHRYIARIELSEPTPEARRELHRAMATAGFTPRAAAPGEEFVRECESEIDEVFEAARLAAARTGLAFSALLTEAASRRWIGVRVCRRAS